MDLQWLVFFSDLLNAEIILIAWSKEDNYSGCAFQRVMSTSQHLLDDKRYLLIEISTQNFL